MHHYIFGMKLNEKHFFLYQQFAVSRLDHAGFGVVWARTGRNCVPNDENH